MERKKSLGFLDLLLFTFSAVFGLEAISATAAIGFSAIFWWIMCAVAFFIPFGFITAELGSSYPDQGGMYVWIKRAFGRKWAGRSAFWYWIALPIWIPAILISIVEIFSKTFSLTLDFWQKLGISVFFIWITVIINICPLKFSKWFPNIGSITKLSVIFGVVASAIIFLIKNGGPANSLEITDFLPNFNAGIVFIPMIIYNLLGFELMSGASGEMKNPTKDIPKTIFISVFIILFLYLISIFSIWIVVPIKEIHVALGLFDVINNTFSQNAIGNYFSIFFGACISFTLFSGVITWTLGENRTITEAANNGDLPHIFGSTKNKATPINASIISGVISTVVILLYGGFAKDSGELFWKIISFSTIVSLFSYIILFPAFLTLRKKDKEMIRPYKVPGPYLLTIVFAVIADLFLVGANLILLIQPGNNFIQSGLPILIGTLFTVLVGEILIKRAQKNNL